MLLLLVELLEALLPQVKDTMGAKFSDLQIVDELRASNYDIDRCVISLLEKSRTSGNNAACARALPLLCTCIIIMSVAHFVV